MNSREPSSDTAMPRGFWASLSVAVTRSVAVSMIEIDAEPSLGTYANGAATVVAAHTAADATAKRIGPCTCTYPGIELEAARTIGMLHEFARAPTGAIPMESSKRGEERCI